MNIIRFFPNVDNILESISMDKNKSNERRNGMIIMNPRFYEYIVSKIADIFMMLRNNSVYTDEESTLEDIE